MQCMFLFSQFKKNILKKKKKKQNLCGSTNVPTSIGRNN